jgi:hypothetical protein
VCTCAPLHEPSAHIWFMHACSCMCKTMGKQHACAITDYRQMNRVYANALVARSELGGICPCVHRERISDVLLPILKGALAGDNGLNKVAEHGDHCQTAIFYLLHLELCEVVWIFCETEWVKVFTSWIDGIQGWAILAWHAPILPVALYEPHQNNLYQVPNLLQLCRGDGKQSCHDMPTW